MRTSIILFSLLSLLGNATVHLFGDTFASKTAENGTLGQYLTPTNPGEELSEVEILNLEALRAIRSEDWKTASDKLKKAFSKDPNDPDTFVGFAKFHYARKEYASSENAIIKGLEKAPMHAGLLYEQSRISALKGDLSLATVQAKKASESEESEWRHHYWLSHLLSLGNNKSAAKKALKLAVDQIGEDIKKLNSDINKYELQEKVLSSYTAIEEVPVGTIGGGYKQIEVVKYNTERMVAPEEWKNQLQSLKEKKNELEQKLKSM